MRLGPGLLYEGRTLQGARAKLAGFCSAPMAEFYSAVDNHVAGEHLSTRPVIASIVLSQRRQDVTIHQICETDRLVWVHISAPVKSFPLFHGAWVARPG